MSQIPATPPIVPGLFLPVRRHECWRLIYRRNRYLENAPEVDLINRARDIISNITGLTYDGKIDFLPLDAGGAYWMEVFTHVLEEQKLRGTCLPPGFMKDASVPKPTFPMEPRAKKLLRQLGSRLADHEYVAKLGKLKYLEKEFNLGHWRISPASSYAASDPSLSLAQRDTELQRRVYWPKSKMRAWDGKTGKFKGEIESLGNITVTSTLNDYYVSCLTKRLDLRRLGLSPGVRQTVKTLFAVRWNCIVLRRRLLAKCAPAGEAEAGSAGVQPAKE